MRKIIITVPPAAQAWPLGTVAVTAEVTELGWATVTTPVKHGLGVGYVVNCKRFTDLITADENTAGVIVLAVLSDTSFTIACSAAIASYSGAITLNVDYGRVTMLGNRFLDGVKNTSALLLKYEAGGPHVMPSCLALPPNDPSAPAPLSDVLRDGDRLPLSNWTVLGSDGVDSVICIVD